MPSLRIQRLLGILLAGFTLGAASAIAAPAARPARAAGSGILFGEYLGDCNTKNGCGNVADPYPYPVGIPPQLQDEGAFGQNFYPAITAWQGRHDAIVNYYEPWGGDPDTFLLKATSIWNEGSVPSVSWDPPSMGTDTATGAYDAYLTAFANVLKQYLAGPDGVYGTADDRRIYIRLAYEMNGDWQSFSPTHDGDDECAPGVACLPEQSCSQLASSEATFASAWRHIHDLVMTQAATDAHHVAWDFSANWSDSDTAGCDGSVVEHMFPGDNYVDWVGIDGYNWGGMSPAQVFGPMAARLRAISKRPLAIDEWGDNAADPATQKATWINDLFTYAAGAGFQKITAFNADKEYAWGVFQPPSGVYSGNDDTTYTYGGVTYDAWTEYKTNVDAANMIGADPANPRLLTDDQFLGQSRPSLTVTDDLYDYQKTFSHSALTQFDTSSPACLGDDSRLIRDSAQTSDTVAWHLAGMTSFSAVEESWPSEPVEVFTFLASPDGITFTPTTATYTVTAGCWNTVNYTVTVPAGTNYLEVQFPVASANNWNPQLGQVTLSAPWPI